MPKETADQSPRHRFGLARHVLQRLRGTVESGQSAATPAILAAGWAAVVLPLIAVVVTIALGAAYLATGTTPTWYYPPSPEPSRAAAPASNGAPASTARALFAQNCAACHGPTGHGGIGPDLTTLPAARDRAVVIHQITYGGKIMPSFRATLTREQIDTLATYVSSVLARQK